MSYKVIEELSKGAVALGILYMGVIGQIPPIVAAVAALGIVVGVEIVERVLVRVMVERFIDSSRKNPESDAADHEKISDELLDKLEEIND